MTLHMKRASEVPGLALPGGSGGQAAGSRTVTALVRSLALGRTLVGVRVVETTQEPQSSQPLLSLLLLQSPLPEHGRDLQDTGAARTGKAASPPHARICTRDRPVTSAQPTRADTVCAATPQLRPLNFQREDHHEGRAAACVVVRVHCAGVQPDDLPADR